MCMPCAGFLRFKSDPSNHDGLKQSADGYMSAFPRDTLCYCAPSLSGSVCPCFWLIPKSFVQLGIGIYYIFNHCRLFFKSARVWGVREGCAGVCTYVSKAERVCVMCICYVSVEWVSV